MSSEIFPVIVSLIADGKWWDIGGVLVLSQHHQPFCLWWIGI